ncbi:MAG: hemerythrin domain-containing protein [Rhodobacteraceae bacterium]|nr:hemerythrin domain-containing protein [Paracoccaceae bacterium]
MTYTPLDQRGPLPDALRVLLEDYPRDAWEAHPNFSGLVQFWLERHMMFRRLMEMLDQDAKAMIDRKIAPRDYAGRLSRFGGMLVNQLHGHHQIEDHHYFPVLEKLDTRLKRGFEMLDKDHHAMDGILNRFAEGANGVLGALDDDAKMREGSAAFRREVLGFQKMLHRHLQDEEEIIVPVILKNGAAGLH